MYHEAFSKTDKLGMPHSTIEDSVHTRKYTSSNIHLMVVDGLSYTKASQTPNVLKDDRKCQF